MLVPGEELYEYIDDPGSDAVEHQAAVDQCPTSATNMDEDAARANKKQRIQAFQCEVMRKVRTVTQQQLPISLLNLSIIMEPPVVQFSLPSQCILLLRGPWEQNWPEWTWGPLVLAQDTSPLLVCVLAFPQTFHTLIALQFQIDLAVQTSNKPLPTARQGGLQRSHMTAWPRAAWYIRGLGRCTSASSLFCVPRYFNSSRQWKQSNYGSKPTLCNFIPLLTLVMNLKKFF